MHLCVVNELALNRDNIENIVNYGHDDLCAIQCAEKHLNVSR